MAHSAQQATGSRQRLWPIFQGPFRVFFFSSAAVAALLVPIWVALFLNGGGQSMVIHPLFWHQHEMLSGFLYAAIAGFILTAVANWTGTPVLRGWGLAGLWGLWVAGRLAMAFGADFPVLALAVDLAFMPVLAAIVAFRVWRAGQRRQIILVVMLSGFWGLDVLFHAMDDTRYLHAAVLLAIALVVVIGGRITPAFTTNWLMRRQGPQAARTVRQWPRLDKANIAACLALVLLVALGWQPVWLVAPVAVLAGGLVLVRLAGWRGWRTWPDPLMWILHVGHLWVALGLWLKALALFGLVPATAWLHALGAGAMATMIMAVMTRVTVAHTGRPLQLLRGGIWAYVAVLAAGIVRVVTALQWLPLQHGLWCAAVLWVVAFVLFIVGYWPTFWRAAVDPMTQVDEAVIRQIRGR